MNSLVLSVVANAPGAATALQSNVLDPVALYAGIAVVLIAGWALVDYRPRTFTTRRFQQMVASQPMQPCKPMSACAQFGGRRASES